MDEYAEDVPGDLGGARASPLPWVLFGLTVLLAAVIAVVLMIKVDAERSHAMSAERETAEAKDRTSKEQIKRQELEQQVEALRAENANLKNERDSLQAKLAAATPAKKTAAAAAPAKKTSKKKGKRRH